MYRKVHLSTVQFIHSFLGYEVVGASETEIGGPCRRSICLVHTPLCGVDIDLMIPTTGGFRYYDTSILSMLFIEVVFVSK